MLNHFPEALPHKSEILYFEVESRLDGTWTAFFGWAVSVLHKSKEE
jgi:hypothetical protein